jgi:large subunit ribosomal protein L23
MKSNNVIVKPLMTEKSTQKAQANVYTFIVNEKATKHQVSTLLTTMYKVKISSVRIVIRKGKMKKTGRTAKEKKMPNIKIAYVSVTEGKIDIFPQS